MTQSELEAAVAQATGESRRTIRHRGFSIVSPLAVLEPDDEIHTEPQIVDWDEVAIQRSRRVA